MELVKSRFLKLNMSHVEYVMECLRKNTVDLFGRVKSTDQAEVIAHSQQLMDTMLV